MTYEEKHAKKYLTIKYLQVNYWQYMTYSDNIVFVNCQKFRKSVAKTVIFFEI